MRGEIDCRMRRLDATISAKDAANDGLHPYSGRLIGRMEGLGFQSRAEAALQSLTEEILKSNEIEGEVLDREQILSSIARRQGMDIGACWPLHFINPVQYQTVAVKKLADALPLWVKSTTASVRTFFTML